MENEHPTFRILLIDDNPDIHKDFIKVLLKNPKSSKLDLLEEQFFEDKKELQPEYALHLEISTALQGQEGVACIKKGLDEGRPFALAFVDIRMPPGWNGIETIKHIWELDSNIQIVICTAFSDYSWQETIEELGIRDNLLILKKPFDVIAVRQLACALTKKWQLMQEAKQNIKLLEQTVEERTHSLRDTLSLLEHQATHDSLTSLPNRALLYDRIKQKIAHSARNNSQFAIFFLDIDRFKLINDSFSHHAGDMILQTVASRITESIREEDTLARLSGDEFILLSTISSSKQVENLSLFINKILEKINTPILLENKEVTISASVGVSIYPKDGLTVDKLLMQADSAMYRAKALGGNQFQLFTENLQVKSLTRLERETQLRKALKEKQFFLEYQTQVDSGNTILGVEALVRWHHPIEGTLLPNEFIPLAEDTGLILPLGEWVLRTACLQNKAWQDKGFDPFVIAVNVATKQFMQPDFTKLVKQILDTSGLDPSCLQIEVTENVIINNPFVLESIMELKNMGIAIALDDFGTGNAGLNYLHVLPMTRLKIDKPFVHNISTNLNDEVIIQAIIDIASRLNLEVIAEGVETELQLDFLKSKKCNIFQGYFFSRPVTAEKLEQLLSTAKDGNL
ncbi:MAG: EAL domain-containing protein [Legionella sp.]|nr:EAL domain-containing protein [Legionella sp.]